MDGDKRSFQFPRKIIELSTRYFCKVCIGPTAVEGCLVQYNTIQYSFMRVANRPLQKWHKIRQHNKQNCHAGQYCGKYCD